MKNQFFESKNLRGRKEMTTKKTKIHGLDHKAAFTKYKPKDTKKKNQNTKRIETFSPVSNEEAPKN